MEFPQKSPIPGVKAQELPQGLSTDSSSLAGKIICKRWRALAWAAGGGFGAFGSPSPEGIPRGEMDPQLWEQLWHGLGQVLLQELRHRELEPDLSLP